VAHTFNPSYSGSRDQKDSSSKPNQAKSSRDPISKKIHHKKGLMEWLKMQALSSNSSTAKKKEKGTRKERGEGRGEERRGKERKEKKKKD
jgi:hypothetical protein